MNQRHFVIVGLIVSALALASCGAMKNDKTVLPPEDIANEQSQPAPFPTPEPIGELREGWWGNGVARFFVSESGARLDMGCARGVVPNPIELDQEDMFEVPGTFDPIGHSNRPATFWGHVDEDGLRLVVSYYVSGKLQYTIMQLEYGRSQIAVKCG